MRVVFTFLCSWQFHIGVELELLEKHIRAGDEVSILTCLGGAPACVYNIEGSKAKCSQCIARRFEPLRLVSQPVKVEDLHDYLTPQDYKDQEQLEFCFESVKHSQNIQADNWDVGYSALSSTIHCFRDSALDRQESRTGWEQLLKTGFESYRATKNFLNQHSVDRFYLFNGRFAITRGVLRACQQNKTDVHVFERGCNQSKYMIFENHLPHDRQPFFENIIASWDEAEAEHRLKVGAEFFESRRQGKSDIWISFTKDQEKGKLPKTWDPNRQNVVIFNSSEDEFIGIGQEWQNPIYESQGKAIQQIVEDLKSSDVKLYLRMHPNLAKVDNEDTRRILALEGSGLEIIPATSKISSYDLIDQANRVLTFGSSVGAEATYWGSPSILAGLCYYRELDVAHVANSHEHVIQLILQADLPAKPQVNAIKFGYYLRSFGIELEHFRASTLFRGDFNGTPILTNWSPFTELLPPLVKSLGSRSPGKLRWLLKAIRPFHNSASWFVEAARAFKNKLSGASKL